MSRLFRNFRLLNMFVMFSVAIFLFQCSGSRDDELPNNDQNESSNNNQNEDSNNDTNDNPSIYADVDFSNWKLTLPIDENNNGSPDEYQPAVLVDYGYQTLSAIQPFMFDDITDKSLVFYIYPDVSTTNSSYSRTELRELINPLNARENWTLLEGGIMEGKLKIMEVSENTDGSSYIHPKVILMQIHGIISQEDMALHGFTSNNGPPLLKMTWIDGNLWAYKKSLVNISTSGDDLLDVSSDTWSDIKHNMGYVGYEPFDLKIIATNGKLEIILNNDTSLVYEDISLNKWPFENYFKAGNYLGSTHPDAFSKLKYYELTVTH